MKEKRQNLSKWFFILAGLILVLGTLSSVWLFKSSSLTEYPAMIADAYREEQHHLHVPGSMDVKLLRTGVYGIYYENSLVSAAADSRVKVPPAIDCSLTAQSTGMKVEAVPDYVETNRYWSKEQGGIGVLIMSLTVDEPDSYTFTCTYQDDKAGPEIMVALGPNYFWEFLRVVWKIGLPDWAAAPSYVDLFCWHYYCWLQGSLLRCSMRPNLRLRIERLSNERTRDRKCRQSRKIIHPPWLK